MPRRNLGAAPAAGEAAGAASDSAPRPGIMPNPATAAPAATVCTNSRRVIKDMLFSFGSATDVNAQRPPAADVLEYASAIPTFTQVAEAQASLAPRRIRRTFPCTR